MARYTIEAPDGRKVTIEGDSEPTEADLEDIFTNLPDSSASSEAPKADPKSMTQKAAETFSALSKSIPLSDRIKEAALVGRGLQALENGIKKEDAASVGAKIASGALGGVPEFMANNPVAGAMERGAKIVGAMKDRSVMPKAVTEEGEKLGDELGIAASFATALAPIKEISVAEKITKESANKMKGAREAVARATKDIVSFDSKVRGELFGARVKAGNAFDESLKAVQKAAPDQKVDLMPAFKGLGLELDEAGAITAENPKLLSDIKAVLKKSGNRTLERILASGDASDLTLEQTQDIVKSIKKIPSLAQKLNQGKFAQYTDTDIPIIQFIEDIRDAQLSAFPEFANTLGAYRETMHKFRAIKPYFKESNLISNIVNDFQGKPVIQKFVKDLLPESIVKEIESVRKVRSAIQKSKALGQVALKGAATVAGGGAVYGAGKALLS